LRNLWLDGCTGVTSLGPLAGLEGLQELWLNGCTGVTDLGPLAGLKNLGILCLEGFTVDQLPHALRRRSTLTISGLGAASRKRP
jgi:internalin A